MKKASLLILLFIGILMSCSEKEVPVVESDEDLLVEKIWTFDSFEFISSSNNTNNYPKEQIEKVVNEVYKTGNVSYEFFADNTGKWSRDNNVDAFNWELINKKLFLDFENNAIDTDYLVNTISENELNITFRHEVVFSIQGNEISVTGNYFYKHN